jgi:hypothetical protein
MKSLVDGDACICDAPHIVAEYRAGVPFAEYVFDDGLDRPIQVAVGGNDYWYHVDLIGSVLRLD